MQIDEIYNLIKENKPKIIYISGKTSTGKSTLARKLAKDFSYEIIELDKIVENEVIKPLQISDGEEAFLEVYRGRNRLDWIRLFVQKTQEHIKNYLDQDKKVIINGAIANPITLKEVFYIYPNLTFIYIHPKDIDKYISNLTKRFTTTNERNRQGLPFGFWNLVDSEEFKVFCESGKLTENLVRSIKKYAALSQQESKQRLESFKPYFKNIKVLTM